MQSNPRLSANVLVISVRILVHLPVKLTELGRGGAIGAGAPGIGKLKVGMFLVGPRHMVQRAARGLGVSVLFVRP